MNIKTGKLVKRDHALLESSEEHREHCRGAGLPHHVKAVCVDGLNREFKFLGYFLTAKSRREESKNLGFFLRESVNDALALTMQPAALLAMGDGGVAAVPANVLIEPSGD